MKESNLSKRLRRLISDADKLVRDVRDDASRLLRSIDELRKDEGKRPDDKPS